MSTISNMAKMHFAQEIPNRIFDDEDLVDDSTGVLPTAGLRERFIRRVSKALAATVTISEDDNKSSINIYLSRDKSSPQPRIELDEEVRIFVRAMEGALATIAKDSLGPLLDDGREYLWDATLHYVYAHIDHVIHSLQRTFNENHDTFADLVGKMLGIEDLEKGDSEIDRELGKRIISLHQAVTGYGRSMKEHHNIIHAASETTRVLLHLPTRLKSLLGKAQFANELYQLICALGFPERVYSTLVRAARTSKTFEKATFNLRPLTSSPKRVSFATPATTSLTPSDRKMPSPSKPSQMPTKQEKAKRLQRFEAAGKLQTQPQPQSQSQPQPLPTALGSLLDAAQPYLSQEDRGLALLRLSPASKQDAIQLVGTVLRNQLLPISVNAWHAFGFATVRDKAEEQQLAGLYAALLKEAKDPEPVFCELQKALETNTIVSLFDIKEYAHFRKLFPQLEGFLNASPEKRSTVWRLKQFMKDDNNTEPPACLQRDYGYKFCKGREEVMRLKAIYTRMLNEMGPMKLHNACVHGRLFETATREGVFIDPKDKRLMQNDYPSPFVGFDNDSGLAIYRGPFFKKRLKL